MKLFLPLAVAVFAGESVAGEAGWGSLRYALARPGSRSRLLFSKLVVALVFSLAAVVLVPATALAVGTVAFGWRPFTAIDGGASSAAHSTVVTFGSTASLARLGVGTAYVAAGMASIFAFAFLLSTLTDRPFSAVAGGVGLSLFSRALDNIPSLHTLSPWLPVTDTGTTLWTGFFTNPIQTGGVAHVLEVQAAYTAVFLGAAIARFARSDVLT